MARILGKAYELYETIENSIYRKVFKDDVELDILTFDDVILFFTKEKNKVQNASKCLIAVDTEAALKEASSKNGDTDINPQYHGRLVVRQILLDAEENPIYKTETSYFGRMLIVNDLDQELKEFMNGKTRAILK